MYFEKLYFDFINWMNIFEPFLQIPDFQLTALDDILIKLSAFKCLQISSSASWTNTFTNTNSLFYVHMKI